MTDRAARRADSRKPGLSALPVPFRRRVLVLSEAFHPAAENQLPARSLRQALSGTAIAGGVLVATLNGKGTTPRLHAIDGVDVLELPAQAPWPFHRLALATYQRLRGAPRGKRLWRQCRACIAYAFIAWPPHPIRRLAMIARHLRRRIVDPDLLEMEACATGLQRKLLRRTTDQVMPGIVHANDHRSLLLLGALENQAFQRVGIVRDDRLQAALPSPTRRRRQHMLRSLDRIVVTRRDLLAPVAGVAPAALRDCVPESGERLRTAHLAALGVAELPGTNILIAGLEQDREGLARILSEAHLLFGGIPDLVLHVTVRDPAMMRGLETSLPESQRAKVIFHAAAGQARLLRLYRKVQIILLPATRPGLHRHIAARAAIAGKAVVTCPAGGGMPSTCPGSAGLLPMAWADLPHTLAALARDPGHYRGMGTAALMAARARQDGTSLRRRLADLWRG